MVQLSIHRIKQRNETWPRSYTVYMDIDVKCKTMKLLEKKILRNKSMGYEAMHNVLRYEHFFKQEYNFILKKTIHKKKT